MVEAYLWHIQLCFSTFLLETDAKGTSIISTWICHSYTDDGVITLLCFSLWPNYNAVAYTQIS
jgi:hypothetical protein